ncbi:MAG: MFS transporter [Proteobacteria bacterium]|nr:MFS transporter [Pseudomonadota bacterium]MBI3497563.1 MFS transporter [Pseudomonadota bacterium]
MTAAPAAKRLHYAWIVLAVSFLTLLTAAATRATPGVLLVPLEQEFGWSRATISLAVSINLVLFGLMGPFAAALVERLGARATMMLSLGMVAIGVALTTLMTASWQLILLWGVVVGGGTGMTALALGATVVNRWFTHRRGLAMGMLTASSATGQLIFLPLLATLVQDWGWRWAVIVAAAIGLAMVPIIGLFMRNHPHDLGLNRLGEPGVAEAPKPSAVNPAVMALDALREAMASRNFWLLFGSFFICGLSTNGLIGTHFIAACIDNGISEVSGAGLLAVIGAFDFVGTLVSGWLSDRWNNRVLLFWYYGLRGLSLLFLPYAFDVSFYGLSLFAVFYGLDWVATVPPTVRLTADVFGRDKAGLIFGWIFTGHQLGAAVAAFGAGAIRTGLDDYLLAFIIAGGFCLVAALMSLAVGRAGSEGKVPVAAAAARG